VGRDIPRHLGSLAGMKAADTLDVSADGLGALVGALAVAAAGAVILAFVHLGPLSGHMVAHIASMNVVAPLAAVGISRHSPKPLPRASAGSLWLVTLGQMALLWASHSPPIHQAAQASPLAQAALHVALFASALTFWICIMAASSHWQAMLALLVSGKLACLLGALLIFAPRLLFDAPASAHGTHAMPFGHASLGDQHLAGLLMIAACPLSYVLTAIVLAAQTMTGLERARSPAFSSGRIAGR
jgi:putative membrane protein